MTNNALKSIFILLIVVMAQLSSFEVKTNTSTSNLTGRKVSEVERLFSACVVADAQFFIVKSKPRVDKLDEPNPTFFARCYHDPAIAILRAAVNASSPLCLQSSRSLWLLHCALLI